MLDRERSTRVPVTGVPASFPVAGTEEDERDVLGVTGLTVESHTLRVTQYRNLHLLYTLPLNTPLQYTKVSQYHDFLLAGSQGLLKRSSLPKS